MQAFININTQRDNVTGSLIFEPARNTDGADHEIVRKAYDRLVEDLSSYYARVKTATSDSGAASETSAKPADQKPAQAEPPAGHHNPTEIFASVFGAPASDVPDNLATQVQIAPVVAEAAEIPKLPIGGGSTAANSRIEKAKASAKIPTAPAISVQGAKTSTPDHQAISVNLTGQ